MKKKFGSIIIGKGKETTFCFNDNGKITCETYPKPLEEFRFRGKKISHKTGLVWREGRGLVKPVAEEEPRKIEPSNVIKGLDGIKFMKDGEVEPNTVNQMVSVHLD